MWNVYTMEYYSVVKRKKECICSNMDKPKGYHTETEKEI